MKKLVAVFFALLLFSCFGGGNEKAEEFDQRIIRLEQRVNSLSGSGSYPYSLGTYGPGNSGTSIELGRCQKITKKGTQCKRKAKANGFCWQHGG